MSTNNQKTYTIQRGGGRPYKVSQSEYNELLKSHNATLHKGTGVYILTSKPKKQLAKKTTSAAVRNQRRLNYNKEAENYGFKSRDEVKKLQQQLIKWGYNIGGRNAQGKVANIPDGYFGGYTKGSYEQAWRDHADEMRTLGYTEPVYSQPATVTIGNKKVVATPQNIKVAEKVNSADEFVNTNYGSNAQAEMYTIGIAGLSPTKVYATTRQAFNPDLSFRDVAMNWMTGNNNGMFEGWDAGQQWAAEHPRAAVMADMAANIVGGYGISKGAPKFKTAVRSFGRNIKNAAVQSASATTPYYRVSENVTNAANRAALQGNNRIIYSQMESASMRPGEYLSSGRKANGQLTGNHRGMTGSVHMTPTYETAVYAPENTAYMVGQTPWGNTTVVGQPIRVPATGVPTMQFTPSTELMLDGVTPYQTGGWYMKPTLFPDATKFKKGGLIKKKITKASLGSSLRNLFGGKSKQQKEAEKLEQDLIAKNQSQFAEVGVYDQNSSIGRDITSPDYDWKNYDPADRVRQIFGKPTPDSKAEFKINNPVSNDFETLNNYQYNSPPIENKINGYNSETGLNEIRNFGQNYSRFGGNLDNKARKYGLTADQVADFQRSYGNELTVDGDLGPKTLEAMYRAGRLKRSVTPKDSPAKYTHRQYVNGKYYNAKTNNFESGIWYGSDGSVTVSNDGRVGRFTEANMNSNPNAKGYWDANLTYHKRQTSNTPQFSKNNMLDYYDFGEVPTSGWNNGYNTSQQGKIYYTNGKNVYVSYNNGKGWQLVYNKGTNTPTRIGNDTHNNPTLENRSYGGTH